MTHHVNILTAKLDVNLTHETQIVERERTSSPKLPVPAMHALFFTQTLLLYSNK